MTNDQSQELLDKYGKRITDVSLSFIDLSIILCWSKLAMNSPRAKKSGLPDLEYAKKFQKHLIHLFSRLGLSPSEIKLIEETFTWKSGITQAGIS